MNFSFEWIFATDSNEAVYGTESGEPLSSLIDQILVQLKSQQSNGTIQDHEVSSILVLVRKLIHVDKNTISEFSCTFATLIKYEINSTSS